MTFEIVVPTKTPNQIALVHRSVCLGSLIQKSRKGKGEGWISYPEEPVYYPLKSNLVNYATDFPVSSVVGKLVLSSGWSLETAPGPTLQRVGICRQQT